MEIVFAFKLVKIKKKLKIRQFLEKSRRRGAGRSWHRARPNKKEKKKY
jgi:hypothetical protein